MPHVSICIPSYNRVGLVSQAIESALSQTETDVEVILIDDGSTDGTLGVAARYADSRFRIEKNACRLGLSGNMNRCLELASGTYVKILCDDDLQAAGRVGHRLTCLQQHADGVLLVAYGDDQRCGRRTIRSAE